MAQPQKKPAQEAIAKPVRSPLAAVETTRNSAENAFQLGGNAVKDFMATSAEEAQKAQEKLFAMGREGAESIAKSTETVSKALADAMELSRDGVETCIECANLSSSLAQDIGAELVESTNKAFTDGVELSKEVFSCRTLSDVFELQNRALKSSIDNFFNQSVKLSSMMFEYSSEALEPINERISQTAEQITKIVTGNSGK